MPFEVYWEKVKTLGLLPNAVIQHLPEALGLKTKKRLMRKEPEETARILIRAFEQIDKGSVERIDNIVRRLL